MRRVICELWDKQADTRTTKRGVKYTHLVTKRMTFDSYEEMKQYADTNNYIIKWWWYTRN